MRVGRWSAGGAKVWSRDSKLQKPATSLPEHTPRTLARSPASARHSTTTNSARSLRHSRAPGSHTPLCGRSTSEVS
ncbi:hypothetical protein B5X24_HaOG206388 [Helicoverpa armigera]|nr:hypothetical protein B5X24_HaOG206388 [Helicoverpa armigera]